MNRIKIFHAGEKSFLCLNGEVIGGVLSYEIKRSEEDNRAEVTVVFDAEEATDYVDKASDIQTEARVEKYRNEIIDAIMSKNFYQSRADFWYRACMSILALLGGVLVVLLIIAIASVR